MATAYVKNGRPLPGLPGSSGGSNPPTKPRPNGHAGGATNTAADSDDNEQDTVYINGPYQGQGQGQTTADEDSESLDGVDDKEILDTMHKLVVTKSLKLQRVTKLIEATRANALRKATHPRHMEKVFITVVFVKIGEIDTMKEQYSADVFIQARWRESHFDGQVNTNTDAIKWTDYWNPRLTIDNAVGDPKETISYSLLFNARQEAYAVEQRRVKGLFIENLELDQFPFDTQELTLTILSHLSNDEVVIEQDSTEMSTVNVQSFVDEQEWRLYRNVEVQKSVTTLDYHAVGDKINHPTLSVACYASRRFGFYVWNIMFVMFFITSMSFVPFGIAMTRPENRIQVTFILLLTTITFKFAVSSSLPRISYLTYLDYYILVSMCFMGIVSIWHAVAPQVAKTWADMGVLIGLGVVFFIINVTFFAVIYFGAVRKRSVHEAADRVQRRRLRYEQKHPTGITQNQTFVGDG